MLNETEEILMLSSKDDNYIRNLNTMKINDLNFDQMNKLAKKDRYVVLGNQIQVSSIQKLFKTEPFYFYTEYLGTYMIDFSLLKHEYVFKDGVQMIKF